MSSLGFWSMLAIVYQTFLCIMVSWLTLGCKFVPDKAELHEITLLKMSYLYDPVACGRLHFYNITSSFSNGKKYASVVWPMSNDIAANFRKKIQLWLSLHLIWAFFAVINMSFGRRSCGFYATLVPFTLAGTALLVVDLVNCVLFLIDARDTYNEGREFTEITPVGYSRMGSHSFTWKYSAVIPIRIVSDIVMGVPLLAVRGHLRGMNRKLKIPRQMVLDDTSWVSVLLAYISIRGVVQWLVNFWIVKDNYFDGLARYPLAFDANNRTLIQTFVSSLPDCPRGRVIHIDYVISTTAAKLLATDKQPRSPTPAEC